MDHTKPETLWWALHLKSDFPKVFKRKRVKKVRETTCNPLCTGGADQTLLSSGDTGWIVSAPLYREMRSYQD